MGIELRCEAYIIIFGLEDYFLNEKNTLCWSNSNSFYGDCMK